jgi:hypothetical protein
MQHNRLNISFDQLLLVAFSLYGQGPVKGARRADLCVQPGIYMPLTGSGHTITLRIGQLIDDRKIVNNFLILCSINWC